MSEKKRHLLHLILLFGDAAVWTALLGLSSNVRTSGAHIRIWLWFLICAAVYLVNAAFQRRRVSLRTTFIADAVLVFAAGLGTFPVMKDPAGICGTARVFLFFVLAGCAVHAAMLPAEKGEDVNIPIYLDGLLVLLFIHLVLWYRDGQRAGTQFLVYILAGLLAALCGLLLLRVQRIGREMFLVPVLFAVPLALSIPAVKLLPGVSKHLLALSLLLRDGFFALLMGIGRFIMRIMEWFAGLFPEQEGAVTAPPPEEMLMPLQTEEAVVPAYLYVISALLIAAFAVIILLLVLRALRGLNWKWNTIGPEDSSIERKSTLRTALRAFRRRILENIRFRISYLRNRNTAAGLLTYAERTFRKTETKPLPGESGPAFLRRLSGRGETTGPDNYRVLADLLEREWYGAGAAPVTAEFCRSFRRKVKEDIR